MCNVRIVVLYCRSDGTFIVVLYCRSDGTFIVVLYCRSDGTFIVVLCCRSDGTFIVVLCCRSDGTFSINNVPSGSYVVEVAHPTYAFEPLRVDINSKGKIRARRLNNVQTSSVQTVSYPLKFKARGKVSYFQQREQWQITDILMNPMVCVFSCCIYSIFSSIKPYDITHFTNVMLYWLYCQTRLRTGVYL